MASLSDSSSRRHLGTQSGAIRREARKLKRDGFRAAAATLAFDAANQRLAEGSAIDSAGRRSAVERTERGLMESRRRASLGGDDSLLKPEAPTGLSAPHANGRPRVVGQFAPGSALGRAEKDLWTKPKPGSSPLDDYENMPLDPTTEARIRNSSAPTTSTSPRPTLQRTATLPVSTATPPAASPLQGPPAPARTLARPGGGLIDGKPAADVLAGMRGRNVPTQPYETNYDGTQQRGPLQTALDEALARNDQRAAAGGDFAMKETGVTPYAITDAPMTGKLRAASPATQFDELTRGDTTPVAAAPAPTLRRPAPPQIKSAATTPNIGAEGFVSLEAPFSAARKKYREEEAKGYKAPLRSATLAVGSGLARFGRDVRKSYQ